MSAFPRDRFDDVPHDSHRVGAHRAVPRRGRRWMLLGAWVLAAAVLTVAGVFGLSRFGNVGIDLSGLGGSSQVPEPAAAEPVTDPSQVPAGATIAVLNGTSTQGLANDVADALAEVGWPIDSRGNTANPDVKTTTVYYADPASEGLARGLLLAIGDVGQVVQSDAFPSALTIVLGADAVEAGAGD